MARLFSIIFLLLFFAPGALAAINSYPGNVARVVVTAEADVAKITADYGSKKIEFFKTPEGFRGFIPSLPEAKPGQYKLTLNYEKQGGVIGKIEDYLKLNWKKFPTVYFTIVPSRKKLKEHVPDEWAEIEKILVIGSPAQMWESNFIYPVPGIITMHFGTKEFVNNKPSGAHRGVDFRAAIGTEIKAVNSGKVVYTKILKAFGGTVIIDHGQGVYSLYFHLSKFLIEPGTAVKKGEVVALSGNSGISSGPHLHWGLSVNNVRVNPIQWIKQAM